MKIIQNILRPDFFLFVDLGESLPYNFSPSRKIKLLIIDFYFVNPPYFWGKIYQHHLYFSWEITFIRQTEAFLSFYFLLSPQLLKFQNFPVE